MSEFFQTNRAFADKYRAELEKKFRQALKTLDPPGADPARLQAFYLAFKNVVCPLVQDEENRLQKEMQTSDNCHLHLLKNSALVDVVIQSALSTSLELCNAISGVETKPEEIPIAIAGQGSYGREEMYYRSDAEIQILINGKSDQDLPDSAREVIKHFEYLFLFQDIFPATCGSRYTQADFSNRDLEGDKILNFFLLLQHRFIVGNRLVYAEFKSSIKTASLLAQDKIAAYCANQRTYYDVQNTVFQQEPNVREELRRLYWALSMAQIKNNLERTNHFELLYELYERNIIGPVAFKNMQKGLTFLAKVRLLLHCHQRGAHRDVLSYEVREKIAQALGYDVKQFFQEYFFNAVYPLKRYSRNLFWESLTSDTEKVDNLTPYLAINSENQIIFDRDPEDLFRANPQWIFQVFPWVAQKNYHLSYPVTRSIEEHVDQNCPIFLEENVRGEILECFRKVIEGPFYAKALRLLHEFGLLSNYYIHEFKDICGLLQDIYVHKFPTDMHVLSAMDELNRLEQEDQADPFLRDLYYSIKNKTALILSVLLHDIGKGARTKDQNEELVGARMIPRILANLGYGGDTRLIQDVAFLVEKHLTMWDLMLLDPEEDETYDMVWDLVNHDKERLKMLVLLTYADRGGTKIKMSASQIGQLKLFYQYTLHHKKRSEVPNSVKLEFLQMVRLPNDLQAQLEIYNEFLQSKEHFIAELLFKPGAPADLVVCTKDVQGLLYQISTVLAYNHLDIVEANIQTLKDNVFDCFKIIRSDGTPIDHSEFYFVQKKVKDDLRRIFIHRERPIDLYRGLTLAPQAHKPVYKEVKLKLKIIGRAVKLATHDVFGTFMMEAKVFSDLHMQIQRAVLQNHQGTGVNIFYLLPEDVEKIINNQDRFLSTMNSYLSRLISSPTVLLDDPLDPERPAPVSPPLAPSTVR
ncbi:MAG: hypothetical protein COV67_10825 [Nitrospinae bacterium CG11_big_fil_rev_8_21_14_0_20_56_8]|nr:MAG: hypothetical protein COV67_10825 [Nitrospinae bacterium CG11_big_fil_rev_8_21_14_0_20_56_8]